MRKEIITTILLSLSFFITGQTPVNTTTSIVGKNLITQKEIKATQYEFGDYIYRSRLDTTLHTLTLQLRGVKSNGKYFKNSGTLAVFDLNSKDLKWSEALNYGNTEIEQYDGVLFWNEGIGSTKRIDLATGNCLWTSKIVTFATIPRLNIALGYKYNAFEQQLSKKLSCINLTTGNILWERPLERTYGWDGVMNLNDTALIVKSGGLHKVSLKDGSGWDFSVKTGIKDYSKTVGTNVAGVALGLLTGTFMFSTGYDMVSNLASNVSEDSLNYYFASKDNITCLLHNGVIKWQTELPEITSHSNLFIDTACVYLINDGNARYNGKQHNFGKPYIAAFDISTGKQLYMSIFDLKDNPLIESIPSKDSIDLFFKDRSIRCSLKDGNSRTILYDMDSIGNLEYTINMFNTYLQTDSTFTDLHSLNPRAVYMMSTNDKVIKLDANLKFKKNISLDKLYSSKEETDRYKFLYNNNKIFIINNDNKAVAELNLGRRIFIFNNKLYEINAKTITEIDLESFGFQL